MNSKIRGRLDILAKAGKVYMHNKREVRVSGWEVQLNEVVIKLNYTADGAPLEHRVALADLDTFLDYFIPISEGDGSPNTLSDLRDFLMKNIVKLQNKEIAPETAKEIANQAQTIVNITKLELQYYKEFKGKAPNKLPFIDNGPLVLADGIEVKEEKKP